METRHTYAVEMQQLEHKVLEMASLVESMVGQATEALCALDIEQAMAVLRHDDRVDELDYEIESACLRLIALQQPTGSDFRAIGTILKMITDVERVGDLACDLAKCGMKIEKEMGATDWLDIRQVANVARAMFRDSIQAFVRRDLDGLDAIAAAEIQVDDLYRELRGQVHAHMIAHPEQVVTASWMLLALHHLERVADHAINVAERVAFMVTGQHVELARYEPGTTG